MPIAPARATAAEREHLVREFVELCEIESPSGRERTVAEAVAGRLRAAGAKVEADGSGGETGSDSGNLLSRIPGPDGAPTVLLAAHLDTVPLEAPVEVAREDGYLSNRNRAVLGADNKAAVAVLLAVARRAQAHGAPVGLELLFTTCEERALAGAKALDPSWLRADFGFVFDHASPIGELIMAAPTYYAIDARFRGRAAHAGIRPEDGHSAIAAAAAAISRMPLGRVDRDTTANAGVIEGGTAPNVVAEHCRVALEARSLDHDRASALAQELVDAALAGASDHECDVETDVEQRFRGYRMSRSQRPVEVAGEALSALGIEPSHVTTGGGSDANVFNLRGLPCLNVANGTEHNHEPDERVSVGALEAGLDVALEIVRRSA